MDDLSKGERGTRHGSESGAVVIDSPAFDSAHNSWSIPRRFVVLDTWRGLAALWVAAFHFRVMGHITETRLIRSGPIAVDFFFVLSGFVIWHGFGAKLIDRRTNVQFLIRRFGRLYPLHIATLSAVVVMEFARSLVASRYGFAGPPPFTGDYDWRLIPANIFLVQGLGFIPDFSWNVPSWSISVEFALCFCFVGLAMFRRPIAGAAILTGAGFIALIVIPLSTSHLNESSLAFPRGVAGFFLGVLIRESYNHLRGWTPNGWVELTAAGAIIGSIFLSYPAAIIAFGYSVWIFGFETGGLSRALKRPWLVRRGELSYSIYLTHYPIVLATFAVAGLFKFLPKAGGMVITGISPWVADVLLILFLGIVVGLSELTYRWIEQPARSYFNKRAFDLAKRGQQKSGRPPAIEAAP